MNKMTQSDSLKTWKKVHGKFHEIHVTVYQPCWPVKSRLQRSHFSSFLIPNAFYMLLCFFFSDQDYQPVHSLKAVVVNASSIVLTWEKPPDIKNPSDIKVSFRVYGTDTILL